MTLFAILAVGATTGFLGGLFGKGGSALATPVLAALGIPPIVAVAGPLPATIPGTLLAARQYQRLGLVDRRVTFTCVVVGLPATVVGALLTRWVAAEALVTATDLIVLGLGVSILVGAQRRRSRRAAPDVDLTTEPDPDEVDPLLPAASATADIGAPAAEAVAVEVQLADEVEPTPPRTAALIAVALGVGVLAGLLANSGGFLLAPLFLVVLKLPVRTALGTSLAVSAALAVPGTITHGVLGHLDLGFVATFALASVPFAVAGARVGLRIDADTLERGFGAALVLLASVLLV